MLRKHVFSTVVYYDCLDFCPTAFEVWKHLLVLEDDGAKPVSLSAVTNALRDLVTERRVVVLRGMYLLPGREEFVPMRIREEKISVGKLKRAQRLIRMLQWVPFVRMIGIAGSLAMKKSEPKSDWDFFVILRSGHIWLGRTFLTGILQLLGKRRHGQYVENRACLNYYLTEEALEISGKDAFAAHEYRFIVPIFDRDVFRRFELAGAPWRRSNKG
ncbi:MAG: hypothetical protein ABI747_02455, partial [Candidatus Moraniibacteriota bacterium]